MLSKMLRMFTLMLASVLLSGTAAIAQPHEGERKFKAEQCVESEEIMRRDHMEFIKHQRDETMRDGVRTGKYSLKGCIDCHAINGDDGKPVTVSNPKHFCAGCHRAAAVKLDCFECHRSTPDEAATLELKRTTLDSMMKTEGGHK